MSNTNTNLQTQTSNALHNAIMEAGGKYHPPMLAPGNYVQWKSRIKRYINNKPNNELIYYCLQNPPYKFKWTEKIVLVTKGIDNDIYSIVDACPNACEIWKAIERFYKMMNELVRNKCDVINHQVNVQFLLQLQPEWQRGKAIVNSPPPTYNQEPKMVVEDDALSKEKEIDKLMALISLSFKKIYKPTNNNLKTSSNTSRADQDNTPRINRGTGYDNHRVVNVVGARENVEQDDWRDDTDDEPDDQESEAHYLYIAKIQEVTPDAADNSGPIFDTEPLQKEQEDNNINIDPLDMCSNGETIDQDNDDDLAKNFLKKAQRPNPRLYDIGCYNDNLALMLAPESDETIHLAHESRSKLIVKCERLEKELSKSNITSKSFEALQHAIDLELALQQCLKAQLQDKGIEISELKKLIEKMKGKSVEAKFEKPFVIRQPNAFKSQRQSVLGMYKVHTKPNETRTPHLPQDIRKTNKRLIEIILFIVDSGCSKHMTGNLKLLSNFLEKFLGTVKFGNDQIAPILGYGDLVQGNVTIKRVYYVEGPSHNLFSVGQFCDADLEVAFQKSICYICDLKGNDLLTASRSTNLYSITL
ncbi:hypothetical protein Tco_0001753 [Tanacetum coccineum]